MAGAGKPGMWLVETISFGNLATLWMWPFAETSSIWSPAASGDERSARHERKPIGVWSPSG
jgi:hypothetical protein